MKPVKLISFFVVAAVASSQAVAITKALPPLPPANGIYNYTVAADYYYGSARRAPSLYSDLTNSTYSKSQVQYIFPDFVYLNAVPQQVPINKAQPPQSITVQTSCPNGSAGKISFKLVNYISVPIISPVIYSGVLGGCQSGSTITSYYSSISKNLKVIPHVSFRADDNLGTDFGGYIASLYDPTNQNTIKTTTAYINSVADAVAALVTNDPNAFGIAFDNEPAIGNIKIHGPNAPIAENIFYREMANQLLKQGKYLFVYDANSTMKSLWPNFKNTVILEPLYDFGENNKNPDTLASMATTAQKMAGNFLSGSSAAQGQPVMFVVPASATSTYWETSNIYNLPANPSPFIPAISVKTQCVIPSSSSIAYIALTGSLVTGETLPQFYSACNQYKNPYNTSMASYFNAALAGVKYAKDHATPAGGNYLGVAMYAWRIHDYNDIDGFKGWGGNFVNYVKNTNKKILKSKNDNGPADITPAIWTALGAWQSLLLRK